MKIPSDLRHLVDTAVAARHPIDEREATSIDAFRRELARLPEPFSESADPVHVTASAIVTGPQGVLLHLHKRLGIWLQPGGHVEPDELPWDAAVRETLEETGLTAVHTTGEPLLVHVDVHPGPRGHTHLDLRYLLTVTDDRRPDPAEGESREVRWFTVADARAIADPALVGALDAWAAFERGR